MFSRLAELAAARVKLGLPMERELHFEVDYGTQRRRTPLIRNGKISGFLRFCGGAKAVRKVLCG